MGHISIFLWKHNNFEHIWHVREQQMWVIHLGKQVEQQDYSIVLSLGSTHLPQRIVATMV
jgi:hypothetical protein